MGLKWRHHSRYYIQAWENGPYLVYEKRWWRNKFIAQFNQSLQMAIWYVQDLDPNSSVGIVWFPRGINETGRPAPGAHADPTCIRIHTRGNTGNADPDLPGTPKPAIPVGFKPFGNLTPGDTIIAPNPIRKSGRPKYVLRTMNKWGIVEDRE